MTNEELQLKIESLEEKVRLLEASATIPKPVEDALRERFQLDLYAQLSTTTKTGSSEAQAVDEAGIGTYSVLNVPDAFLQVSVLGTTYYIPVWT